MGVPPKPPPLPPTGRAAKPAAAAPRLGNRQARVPDAHGSTSEQAREAAAPSRAPAGPAVDHLRRKQDEKSKVLPHCLMSTALILQRHC